VAGPELVLEQPSQRKTEIRSELDLLIPYQRTTEFVGRGKELESLRAWLESEAAISVRVVTGHGGSGKTRLAVELLEWLAGAEPQQWNCGFLTPAEMERFSGLHNLSQWGRRKPMLAVVDYAAGSAGRLRVWMEQLAAAEHEGEKLRLLLLEREASLEAGWLASVISYGYSAAAVRALLDPLEPVRLDTLAEAADRRSVLRATVKAGAALRGVTAPAVPAKGADALFDWTLEESRWGDPLTLMMAGLNALDTGLVPAMALGRPDLALWLADRERDRIERFDRGAPPGLMAHMAACVTVSGGLAREELQGAARVESEATGRVHPGGWGMLADRVAEALGGGQGARAVGPDVIGEALLLGVWGGTEVREGCKAVARAAKARGQQVAASVVRAAQDFCVGATPRSEPLEWLDTLLAEGKHDLRLLWQIEGALPHHTLALRGRTVEVDAMLAAALRDRAHADQDARAARAGVLGNLGVRLGALGRREEALQAVDEAVRLYRQLAAQRRDDLLPGLATSLGAKGAVLREVGNAAKAAATFREGVELLKPLFLRSPEAFRPLTGNLVIDYLQACETVGLEVDSALLGDLLPLLSDDQAPFAEP
jgi:hypothetical protein